MNSKDYLKIVQSFIEKDGRQLDILNRGLVRCFKPKQNGPCFLLTGINPSFKEEQDVFPGRIDDIDISTANDGYWAKKSHQFGSMWEHISYLDLFPIRETHQHNGFEKSFREETILRKDLLEITQSEIETLAPKLIVHANKDSIYYWGIKKNTPLGKDANDYENPWMGYKVERVPVQDLPPCMRINNRWELFPFYKIVGFQENEKRINQKKYPKKTSIEGSFIMEYVMDDRNPKYNGKLYKETLINCKESPKEWTEIWKWVNKHKP